MSHQKVSHSSSLADPSFADPSLAGSSLAEPPHPPLHHCPHCGREGFSFDGRNRFFCETCEFVYFHNTAAACGAILTISQGPSRGRILLLRRGQEPRAGMLDLPGGFIDPGESAEEALLREIREEVNLTARNLRYFFSASNRYLYRNVPYTTCDLIFTGTLPAPPESVQESEISGFSLLLPEEISLDEIAFPSLRAAMARFLQFPPDQEQTPENQEPHHETRPQA
ncbi:hypothetical protein AU468_08360 [Alkalispirochaeta sphaeroplastigenens]|uniref:Nudix hydrolase domain-containing protein n=1 Tax=Alkalispirochaeta sphaeroplastigenens TaxID=1187066 RepID=A0A2S4JPB9_9SPIO|nr:NUDIX domain-containing protein [Alkalispirochaeta sphaeroplastigenens]POR01320.1 hypothetical protein AU468_08360 [Alkalispirochaeta sphaeroplastigenens]